MTDATPWVYEDVIETQYGKLSITYLEDDNKLTLLIASYGGQAALVLTPQQVTTLVEDLEGALVLI